jgi:hypothetical protein
MASVRQRRNGRQPDRGRVIPNKSRLQAAQIAIHAINRAPRPTRLSCPCRLVLKRGKQVIGLRYGDVMIPAPEIGRTRCSVPAFASCPLISRQALGLRFGGSLLHKGITISSADGSGPGAGAASPAVVALAQRRASVRFRRRPEPRGRPRPVARTSASTWHDTVATVSNGYLKSVDGADGCEHRRSQCMGSRRRRLQRHLRRAAVCYRHGRGYSDVRNVAAGAEALSMRHWPKPKRRMAVSVMGCSGLD